MTGMTDLKMQSEKDQLEASIAASEALRHFYMRSHSLLDRAIKTHGVSFAKARVLAYIELNQPIRSIDLAERFGFSPRSITETIDSLERDQLVERRVDPNDRRSKLISVTKTGHEIAKVAEIARQAFSTEVYGALSPEECHVMAVLLNRLNEHLDTIKLTL